LTFILVLQKVVSSLIQHSHWISTSTTNK